MRCRTTNGDAIKSMSQTDTFLRAVNAAIGFPTIEDLICEGHAVNFLELQEALGDRLILEDRKLCRSHVRSLVTSILEYKAVVLPLILERRGTNYILKDGYHRIAAFNIIRCGHNENNIKVYAKLTKT